MQENTNKTVTVVIPIFNEYEGIPFLVDSLNEFFGQNSQLDAEVIFVNDGSRDNSVERLGSMSHKTYRAKVISFSRNFGSHAALRAGISHASGDYICFNYADLQDPLELVTRMKELMDQGHDIIWAQRESTKVPWGEKMFSKFYASLMKKFAFKNFPEKGFDIVMFNKKVAGEVNKNVEANSSIFLQILGMGFRQTNITYKKRERQTGVSKWTLSKKVKLFIDSFVAFSYAPIRFVTIIGILFFIAGLIWTAYIVIRKVFFPYPYSAGWPAMMSLLSLGFGITNISLGIIAEYLWRTLDASRKRQVFIIDDIKELNR
ncbi:MAG: glycosyltransferase [Bacteroidetes bacterium]|jgi:glycosyltransferase involved in cell wall biosynthesis|nr:MAG: glycosyltransferase [Bacteroidota bacterium]